jgi:hypothetical protein
MADAITTKKQENASLWIIEQALSTTGIKYQTVDQLKNDEKGYNELLKIYPEINELWLKGLVAQQITVRNNVLGGGHYTTFNRDGGFMDFISNLIRDKFKISKKDSWNPADIWVIKNEEQAIDKIKNAVRGNYPTITELNNVMKRMWHDKELKGISLKAISGETAQWEEVNLDDSLFKDKNSPPIFEITWSTCKLNLKNDKFDSTDTIVNVKEGSSSYIFQIRQNSRGFNNLKFEPTKKGFGAARLGKVPLDKLKGMMNGRPFNLSFMNNHTSYPKDSKKFEVEQNKYIRMWKKIKGQVITGINTEQEFKSNFMTAFNDPTTNIKESQKSIATSKLMQLDFLAQVFGMGKEKSDELFTNMAFLAQKKGQGFGPFGKLY